MTKHFTKLTNICLFAMILLSANSYAFSKLTNGLETLTRTYLIPLSGAVAGASFILFVTLSYFKQEEYQKKVANVLVLSVLTGCGLELVRSVIQNFS